MEWFWIFLALGVMFPSYFAGKLIGEIYNRIRRSYRNNRIVECEICFMSYHTRDLWFGHDFGCMRKGCDHEPQCGICILKQLPSDAEVNLNTLLKIRAED